MAHFLIYTKANCPNCEVAKHLLAVNGLDYSAISLDDEAARDEFLALHPQVRQMPAVFVDGQRVGGVAGLRAALGTLGLAGGNHGG